MRVAMEQYAMFLALKATFEQNPSVPRVDICGAMDWLAVEKIEASDFNGALRAVEAEVERAKRRASYYDRADRAIFAEPPMKQRDRTAQDRIRASEVEAQERREAAERTLGLRRDDPPQAQAVADESADDAADPGADAPAADELAGERQDIEQQNDERQNGENAGL